MFLEHVRSIKGYSLNSQAIETAEQLYDMGEPVVVSDVEAAIQNMSRLSDGDLGKLKLRLGL